MRGLHAWLDEQLRLKPAEEFLLRKTVPRHRYSFWYLFGGMALFFLAIQFLTGMLLLLYYSPTPATAYESVSAITEQIPYGWLIRSIHRWSAHGLVATVLVHFFSTFLMKSYRKPRELTWMSGISLLGIIMGFAFTGYLLPWDTAAYFATQIGTEIPRSIPLVGDILVRTLRGGEYITGESLKRLFALHTVILPICILGVISIHLMLNFIHGSSIPSSVQSIKEPFTFYPAYLLREIFAWIIALMALFSLALMFPVQLGSKADPLASAPVGIKPEWYFLPLYQTFRMLPGSILGLQSEVGVSILLGVMLLFLIFLPLLDRKASKGLPSPVVTLLGVAGILYMGLTIIMAYMG